MGKIIFELQDVRETPRSPEKLSIEIRYEPLRQNGKAKELSEFLLEAIDDFNSDYGGTAKIKNVSKYK